MNVLKNSKFKFNLTSTLSFYNLSKFYFTRNMMPFCPIYPGDRVMVLPPWGRKGLNPYKMKMLNKYPQFQKKNKIIIGKVLEMKRKKGYAIVTNTPKEKIYKPIESFFDKYEKKGIGSVKITRRTIPIALNRIRLINTAFKQNKYKVLKVEMKRGKNGKLIRVKKGTKKQLEKKQPKNCSYETRTKDKISGAMSTSKERIEIRTYKGEDYEKIARAFLDRIKEKESVESNLFLKDK
jgi:hypothetical protein